MVVLLPPPPNRPVAPIVLAISTGQALVRIFDPTRRNATALTFRANGPRMRFDHHRGTGPDREPACDPERAVYYAAWSPENPADLTQAFACCLVEMFGDTGLVACADLHVATPRTNRPLRMLDLRDHAAMRAGTVAAISKCEHRFAQPWSRYFYDASVEYGVVDGLVYRNAHNDGPAVILYERARVALTCPDDAVVRLDHPGLRPLILRIMRQTNLVFMDIGS